VLSAVPGVRGAGSSPAAPAVDVLKHATTPAAQPSQDVLAGQKALADCSDVEIQELHRTVIGDPGKKGRRKLTEALRNAGYR
jgi:hypothetical protein